MAGTAVKVFKRGLLEFVIQMSQPITIFCYNQVILAHLGEFGLAAFSACTYLLLIVFGVFLGVSQGIQPLIGNSFGEQLWEDVRRFFRAALKINFVAAIVLYSFYFAVGPAALSPFIKDTNLIPTAYEALKGYGLSMLPASLNIVYITYFLSTKNTARAMIIACSRGIILNSLCVFIVPALLGKGYIWFPLIVAETVTLCIAITVKHIMSKGAGSEKTYKILGGYGILSGFMKVLCWCWRVALLKHSERNGIVHQ